MKICVPVLNLWRAGIIVSMCPMSDMDKIKVCQVVTGCPIQDLTSIDDLLITKDVYIGAQVSKDTSACLQGVIQSVDLPSRYVHGQLSFNIQDVKVLVYVPGNNSAQWYPILRVTPAVQWLFTLNTQIYSLVGEMAGKITGFEAETNRAFVRTENTLASDRRRYAYGLHELAIKPPAYPPFGLCVDTVYRYSDIHIAILATPQPDQYRLMVAVDSTLPVSTWMCSRTFHAGTTSVKDFPGLDKAVPVGKVINNYVSWF